MVLNRIAWDTPDFPAPGKLSRNDLGAAFGLAAALVVGSANRDEWLSRIDDVLSGVTPINPVDGNKRQKLEALRIFRSLATVD